MKNKYLVIILVLLCIWSNRSFSQIITVDSLNTSVLISTEEIKGPTSKVNEPNLNYEIIKPVDTIAIKESKDLIKEQSNADVLCNELNDSKITLYKSMLVDLENEKKDYEKKGLSTYDIERKINKLSTLIKTYKK